jgi:hypothetical protein
MRHTSDRSTNFVFRYQGPFSELWDSISPIFRECARTGHAFRKENDPLSIVRFGYLEETFFSWSFVPIYGGTDRIQGDDHLPYCSSLV